MPILHYVVGNQGDPTSTLRSTALPHAFLVLGQKQLSDSLHLLRRLAFTTRAGELPGVGMFRRVCVLSGTVRCAADGISIRNHRGVVVEVFGRV